jgi:hypothetical protein
MPSHRRGTRLAFPGFEEATMRTHLGRASFSPLALFPLAVAISGCAVIGDVFKRGVWEGVLSELGLAAVLALLVRILGS